MGYKHHTILSNDLWMLILCVVALVVMVLGIIWLIHRNRVASYGLTPVERKELAYPEKEILSMLRQHGGFMMQDEIVDTLPGDLEELAEAIRDMEAKNLIFRKWKHDQSSYSVSAKPKGMENKNER